MIDICHICCPAIPFYSRNDRNTRILPKYIIFLYYQKPYDFPKVTRDGNSEIYCALFPRDLSYYGDRDGSIFFFLMGFWYDFEGFIETVRVPWRQLYVSIIIIIIITYFEREKTFRKDGVVGWDPITVSSVKYCTCENTVETASAAEQEKLTCRYMRV